MDLRRRNKQHVMETMEGKTPAPRAHEFACAHGDEPLIQRVGAFCLASGYSSDCRLDFDGGGRREEKRVLVGLSWPGAKLLNRAVSIGHFFTDMFGFYRCSG